MARKKKEPIKVLKAVIIDNRKVQITHWFVTFKYDGIPVDITTNDAHSLYDRFKRILEVSDPDIKEIDVKLWFVEDRLLLKRTDIYQMYVKLRKMFLFAY